MDNGFSNNPEKVDRPLAENKEKSGKPDSQDVGKASKEFETGVSEVVEGVDMAEESDGNVSEEASGGKNKLGAGAYGRTQGDQAGKVRKPIIPPSVDIMRTQISVMVKKEIAVLQKEAAKVSGGGSFDPEKLTLVVSKIRSLREILANLAYAGAEALKGWWMKYVKGITI